MSKQRSNCSPPKVPSSSPDSPLSRIVSFGGSSVQIEHIGNRAGEIVEFLYRYTRASSNPLPHAKFSLKSSDATGVLTVRHGEATCYNGESAADAARALMEVTSFALAQKSVGGLLFHAATLTWRGRGLLLPGKSGTGKTTLSGWLSTKGLRYLTDELSFVPDRSQRIVAFPRPLNIKTSGLHALRGHYDLASDSEALTGRVVALAQPTHARERGSGNSTPLGLIVFPRYRQDAEVGLTPLSGGQTGLRLMACLLNARNLQAHGFPSVAKLGGSVTAYELTYSDVEQLEPLLADLKAELSS